MCSQIQFNPKIDKWLKDYIAENHKHISNFEYHISNDSKTVEFCGYLSKHNSDSAISGINIFEEKLPITFLEIISQKTYYKFIYKFNDDADFDDSFCL